MTIREVGLKFVLRFGVMVFLLSQKVSCGGAVQWHALWWTRLLKLTTRFDAYVGWKTTPIPSIWDNYSCSMAHYLLNILYAYLCLIYGTLLFKVSVFHIAINLFNQ